MSSLIHTHIEGGSEVPLQVFSFGPMTAIVGDNGSGKTQALEAIHLGALGEIFYRSDISKPLFSITLQYEENHLEYSYRFYREGSRKEYYVQGKKVTRAKYMEHLPFRTVLFSPFDMNLLYFAPSHRRESIDSILKRSFAQFTTVKREYDEVLRQRNALLKQIRDGLQPQKNLDFWDTKLASIGAQYLEYRFRWTDYIEHHTEEIRMALPNHELHFHYMTKSSRSDTETSLRNVIQEHRERDIIVGHTTVGPHLDDFGFTINYEGNTYDAADFLSRGENKVLLLTLKHLEISFLESVTRKSMLLLFDDLFAELDEAHIGQMLERFSTYQLIFTTQKLPDFLKKNTDFTCINLSLL